MVDEHLLARAIASVQDAVQRIREVLPGDAETFASDRTVREVVTLNLFVALQEALSLASHWLADEGREVPRGYRDVFLTLGDTGVLPRDLAARLAAAAGLRNVIAHRYGVLDWMRIHEVASSELDDLLEFCEVLARKNRETN